MNERFKYYLLYLCINLFIFFDLLFIFSLYNADSSEKIIHICDIFGASRFTIPKREDLQNEINKIQQSIYEQKGYLKEAENYIKAFFQDKIGENP